MSPSATMQIIQAEDYGRRLLPVLLDGLARTAPSRIFASIPTSQSYSTGLKDISMASIARAVDRISWWLDEQLGSAVGFPTIAYLGPTYASGGIGGPLLMPLYFELPLILPPAGRPMNADLLADLLDNVEAEAGLIPPSILEDMCASPEMLQKLKKMKYIIYGGGPLATYAGNLISKYTTLRNAVGSTETLLPPQCMHAPENWAYLHANPNLKGMQFRERPDGLYELFMVRDLETDKLHPTWYTFPTEKVYSMKDCYARHPTEPNLWMFKGRGDNVIVLSNGEKFNPVSMEETIQEDSDVRDVIVLGQSRFETAALIEQHDGSRSSGSRTKDGLTRLLTYIERANAEAPGHAKLQEDRILFTKPEKPMLRTEKGTVKRTATLKAHEQEIEELYTNGSAQNIELLPKLNGQDEPSLRSWLLGLFRGITKLGSLTEDEDFFAAGVDSLQR